MDVNQITFEVEGEAEVITAGDKLMMLRREALNVLEHDGPEADLSAKYILQIIEEGRL